MNIDLFSATEFGDVQGIRAFLLAHRFVHDQTSIALNKKYGVTASTFGISGETAEDAWIDLMKKGKQGETGGLTPDSLRNWLQIHADIHNQSYSLLAGTPTVAPDLSVVDFSDAQQFYDWMFVHQQMHDYEQGQLGLT